MSMAISGGMVFLREKINSRSMRTFAFSTAGTVVGRFGQFMMAALLGRMVGPAAYGMFTFASGTALLGSLLLCLGWPNLMNRLIPVMMRDRDWGGLRGFVDGADFVVAGSGIAGALVLVAIAFLWPTMRTGLLFGALMMVPMCFVAMRRQQLAAVGLPGLGLLFDQGFAALVLTVLIAVGAVATVDDTLLAFCIALLASVIITTTIFRRRLPREMSGATRSYAFRSWLMMSLPMAAGIISKQIMNRTDVILLAPLSNLHEVGIYGAAFRITFLMTFPQAVLMSVVMPQISQAVAHNDVRRVRRLFKVARLYALATSLPVGLALVVFPGFVMRAVYGAAFGVGGPTLAVLTIGQIATSFSISSTALLMMSGRERQFGTFNLMMVVVHTAISIVVMPWYGALGAALATAVVYVVLCLAQTLMARDVLRALDLAAVAPSRDPG